MEQEAQGAPWILPVLLSRQHFYLFPLRERIFFHMWPFRRSPTPPDAPERHDVVLGLIEQVAALRGQVRAVESEWDDMRDQIKKGYQRMERANSRADRRLETDDGVATTPAADPEPVLEHAHPFVRKLQQMKGA